MVSQQKKITIKKSDLSYSDEEKYPGATILIGNVLMEHEGALLSCKKAFFYKERNFFKAIGNVLINQGDTVTQRSKYVDYNGGTKRAKSWGNVVAQDPTMTLTTDTLYFDRKIQRLHYKDYATIRDTTNTLNSKNGYYYIEEKKFTATTNVKINNPRNTIESKHLDYYTNTGFAYLFGASTITNTQNGDKIYTEKGIYDTKQDISNFTKQSTLYTDNREIKGDSLYYSKHVGFASATQNFQVIDTAQNFVAKGNYAELFQFKDSMLIVKKAVGISIFEKDSLYIHGDTILVTGNPNNRIVRTFRDVKIFKSNMQGKSDSIHTKQAKGITKMHGNPVLWAQRSQITGDTIIFTSHKETNKLDSLFVLGNSLIVQQDSLDANNYNQIKGKNMYGKFVDNELKVLLVKGSGQAVFYNRNEAGVLETITKQLCSNIEFTFENKEIATIKCFKKSDGNTYPPSKYPEDDRKLKGFIWREEERPKKKEDIFIPSIFINGDSKSVDKNKSDPVKKSPKRSLDNLSDKPQRLKIINL